MCLLEDAPRIIQMLPVLLSSCSSNPSEEQKLLALTASCASTKAIRIELVMTKCYLQCSELRLSWPRSHVQVYPCCPPKGDHQATLGVFLLVDNGADLPGFALTVVNQLDPRNSIRRGVYLYPSCRVVLESIYAWTTAVEAGYSLVDFTTSKSSLLSLQTP